ncbi:MAG TPA: hypothetical protein PLV15_08405, partial [Smithella sp.]|nr:hypothetical protein [Smithella sp.]
MIHYEPEIRVALLQNYSEAHITLKGDFSSAHGRILEGCYTVTVDDGWVLLADSSGKEIVRQKEILLQAGSRSFFTVSDVKIGIDFHWQRTQEQSFRGDLFLSASRDASFNLINNVHLENYLVVPVLDAGKLKLDYHAGIEQFLYLIHYLIGLFFYDVFSGEV